MKKLLILTSVTLLAGPLSAQQVLRHIDSDPATGSSAAVIAGDVPLVHTAQLLAVDDAGTIRAAGDAAAQLGHVLDQLELVLKSSGSSLGQTAKLNVYIAKEELGEVVEKTLAARFRGTERPAVSLVATPLPDPAALVAIDAVAAAPIAPAEGGATLLSQAAILPAGSRLYVSGQAEPGTLREATRKTLASLSATLKHCGRTDRDIVQLKCFLQPMRSTAQVRDEIAAHFGGRAVPPVVFVEWRSTAPIEIELVAWGGPANRDAREPLEFLTPPGLSPSPLFSRVARIHRGDTIFLGDLYGDSATGAEEHVAASFERLKALLDKTGSDLGHLAKATYYVTNDEVSKAHNAVRPKYYDPQRPPAASKAVVASTGRVHRDPRAPRADNVVSRSEATTVRYVMDMVAVPARKAD